MYRKS